MPLNFTRQPRFTHDPAYTAPPLPALAPALEIADCDARTLGFARTQLVRGRNRFVAAAHAAARLAEGAR